MVVEEKAQKLQQDYFDELENNPKYSLEVDPENKYDMSETQKMFIKQYVDTKNISTAAYFAGIDNDVAKAYYLAYNSQLEIRRINMAMYQRQFKTKLLSLDEIGGYLSSLLTDSNVAEADRLKTTDKLRVAQMLIDLNITKINALQNPELIIHKDIDNQLKNLSLSTIKDLLNHTDKPVDNDIIYEVTNNDNLTPEESAYLSTLSTNELLNIIETTKKEEKNEK